MSAPSGPRALAAKLLASSPLAMPLETALQEIRQRRKKMRVAAAKPDPDFTAPEPMPFVDAPEKFATAFWSKRRPPDAEDKPPKPNFPNPRGRKPLGELPPEAGRFRVIDGDRDD